MLEMKPDSYLINAADLDSSYAGSCIMGVIVTPEVADLELFILGDVFLRNFYSVFDYKNQKVSVAINRHAQDDVRIYVSQHNQVIVFYVLSMLFFIVVTVIIGLRCASNMHKKMMSRVITK